MDELSQKRFDAILKKEVAALSVSEIEFLKARRSYLTPMQLEVYKNVLSTVREDKKLPNLNRSRSYRALQHEAASLGLHVVGVTREELERSIDTARGGIPNAV